MNGDGYADVVVGAWGYDGSQGKVYVYHGSAGGLGSSAGLDGRGRQRRRLLRLRGGHGGRRERRRLRRRRRRRLGLRDGQARRGPGLRLPRFGDRPGRHVQPGPPTGADRRRPLWLRGGHGGRRERRRLRRPDRRRRGATAPLHGQGLRLPRRARPAWRRAPAWTASGASRRRPASAAPWARRATSTATATPTSSSAPGATTTRRTPTRAGPTSTTARRRAWATAPAWTATGEDSRATSFGRLPWRRRGTSTATATPTSSSARLRLRQPTEGRVYVYHGSAAGLSSTRRLDRRGRARR